MYQGENCGIREKLRLEGRAIQTINLKADMPPVAEALQRLERQLTVATQKKVLLLKIVHGYGSTGTGGEIRIAVQKRLREYEQSGRIRGCIFGEDWAKSNEVVWRLVQTNSELKTDSDLGRRNQGITIVLL